MISSDHSPCPASMKEADNFFDAWGGIAGAQSSVELMVGEGPCEARLAAYAAQRLALGRAGKAIWSSGLLKVKYGSAQMPISF